MAEVTSSPQIIYINHTFLCHKIPKIAGAKRQWRRKISDNDRAVYKATTQELLRVSQWSQRRGETVAYRIGHICMMEDDERSFIGRLTEIKREDVRDISDEDIIISGFSNRFEFWQWWCLRYDPFIVIESFDDECATVKIPAFGTAYADDISSLIERLKTRPYLLYQGWVLTINQTSKSTPHVGYIKARMSTMAEGR